TLLGSGRLARQWPAVRMRRGATTVPVHRPDWLVKIATIDPYSRSPVRSPPTIGSMGPTGVVEPGSARANTRAATAEASGAIENTSIATSRRIAGGSIPSPRAVGGRGRRRAAAPCDERTLSHGGNAGCWPRGPTLVAEACERLGATRRAVIRSPRERLPKRAWWGRRGGSAVDLHGGANDGGRGTERQRRLGGRTDRHGRGRGGAGGRTARARDGQEEEKEEEAEQQAVGPVAR